VLRAWGKWTTRLLKGAPTSCAGRGLSDAAWLLRVSFLGARKSVKHNVEPPFAELVGGCKREQ
jgi:hypothetical protein